MSVARWRNILLNWINCYDEGTDWSLHPDRVLHGILDQLRASSLDHSASLEAQNLDDFIRDKYPEFKFENGTSQPTSDDDMCMAASLLLLYVCVQCKDVDIKNVMCSRLSREDQEVILKFTKCLMNRTTVTYDDVRTAVNECSGDAFPLASGAAASTPPPLRALHCEVRRLRAALDAERFDRTYLQDELLATGEKVDKLLKDKEQYQREIASLRAQLSEGSGELERSRCADSGGDGGRRVYARQLSALEERLADTQAQLEDCERARLLYKNKVEELKQERDKWVEFGKQESGRACSLAERLESEQRTAAALREMLGELRAHHKLGRDDSSMLECDDDEARRDRSFAHDSSMCGDLCASVVEVQLCEERARVSRLTLELQAFEDKVQTLEASLQKKKEEMEAEVKSRDVRASVAEERLCEERERVSRLTLETQAFEHKVKELEASLQKNDEEIRAAVKLRTEWQVKLDEKNIILQHATIEIEELKSEKELLDKKVTHLKDIIKSNKSLISQQKKEKIELRASVKENTQQKAELQVKLDTTNNIVKQATIEIEELKSDNELLKKKVTHLEDTIKSYKSLISQQENESVELRATAKENTQKNTELQVKLDEKNNILQQATIEIEKLKAVKELLENKVTHSEDIIKSNKLLISQQENENVELRASAKESSQQRAELQSKLSENDNSLQQATIEIKELKADKELLENKVTNFDDIIKSNKSLISKQEKEIIELRATAKENTQQRAELQSKLSENDNSLQQATIEIEELKAHKELLEKKVTQLDDLNKSNKSLISQQENENVELRATAKENTQQKAELQLILNENNNILQQANIEIEALKADKWLLVNKVMHLEDTIKSNELLISQQEFVNIELRATAKENTQQKAELQSKLDENINSLQQATIEIEERNADKELLKKKVTHLEDIIKSNKSLISKQEKENVELIANYKENTQQKAELQVKLDTTNNIVKQATIEIEELKSDNELLKKKVTHLEDTIKSYKSLISQQENESVELRATAKENTQKNTELQVKLDENNNILKQATIEMEELKADKELLENKVSHLEVIIKSNELLITQQENENVELRATAEENTQQTAELLVKLNENHNILKQATVEIEELKSEKELFKKTVTHLEDRMKSNKSLISQLENENIKLRAAAEENTQHRAELQIKLDENNNILQKAHILIEELKTARELLESKVMHLEEIIKSNESLISQQEFANVELRATAKENTQQKAELQSKLDDNNNSLQQATIEIEELKADKEVLENKLTHLDDIIKSNKSLISKQEEEIVELRATAKENTQHKAELQVKLDGNHNILQQATIKMEELKADKELLENKFMHLEDIIKSNESLISQQEFVNVELRATAQENTQQNAELQSKLDENNNSLQRATIEIKELKADKELLEKKVTHLDDIIKSNKSLISKQEKENVELRVVLDENNNILQQATIEMEELKANKEMLENKVSHLEDTIKSNELLVSQHENENVELRATAEKNSQQNAELQVKLDENNNILKQATVEIEALRSEKELFEKKFTHLEDIMKSNKLLISQLENKNVKLRATAIENTQQRAELQVKLDENNNILQQATIIIEELKADKELLNIKIKEQTQVFKDKLQEKVEEIKAELKIKDERCNKLNQENAELQFKIDENHNILQQATIQLEELKADKESLEKKLIYYEDNIASHMSLISQLRNDNLELRTIADESTQLMDIKIKEHTQAFEDKVKTLETSLHKAEEEIKVEVKLRFELCDKLNQQKTEFLAKLHENSIILQQSTIQIEELKSHKESLEKKVTSCEEIITSNKLLISQQTNEKVQLRAMIKESTQLMNIKIKELIEEKELLTKEWAQFKAETEENAAIMQNIFTLVAAAWNSESDKDTRIQMLANEVAALSKSIAHREDLINEAKVSKEKDTAELKMKVNLLSSDLVGNSEEKNVTISNLEKIIHDKNRTITTLQGDITYLKSLVAESENKLLDVSKELEQCRENCQQLSAQLRRCVSQKNDEINNLKKTLSKLSTTENSASQIIKVSAKYQMMILKRIEEIKSNAALRELTQFSNIDDKRRSLASGTVTMDELENFLESTEKQVRKLTEKQYSLQKERDHLAEISKINESEMISVKKYLTELLAHFKTFSSVKELYNQKLSQVISQQRMIRREIHGLEQNIPHDVMSKLERSYGVVMQDLVETSLNLGRWSERCIDRSISPEKLKQAFAGSVPSLSTSQFQSTGLEVQIEELSTAFRKVQEEVERVRRQGGGARAAAGEACSVMEVRAEYEDKLNRMKAKMKQLYHEQMSAYQARQEAELDKLRRRLEEKTKHYEEHIASLTKELWSVGEKFLMKKEEAEWLRRRPSSSSLMSLQHVHSSGLGPPPAREPRETRGARAHPGRPSDTQSLHGLPTHHASKPPKSEGRGVHMSDEEGEVFDNRWLRELETPPGRAGAGAGAGAGRISELQYRNSLCPPHLKSSYPAETQFAVMPCNEEDIKFEGGAAGGGERRGRKEVGITAYKKPGPPTPSKNAGRLSATDSELRESLRPDASAGPARKTSTPSRLRALFRSARSDRSDTENTGTPRSKRLSIFRKKQ